MNHDQTHPKISTVMGAHRIGDATSKEVLRQSERTRDRRRAALSTRAAVEMRFVPKSRSGCARERRDEPGGEGQRVRRPVMSRLTEARKLQEEKKEANDGVQTLLTFVRSFYCLSEELFAVRFAPEKPERALPAKLRHARARARA